MLQQRETAVKEQADQPQCHVAHILFRYFSVNGASGEQGCMVGGIDTPEFLIFMQQGQQRKKTAGCTVIVNGNMQVAKFLLQ